MKKLVQILPLILIAAVVNAQQTEDDVYVGKSRPSEITGERILQAPNK